MIAGAWVEQFEIEGPAFSNPSSLPRAVIYSNNNLCLIANADQPLMDMLFEVRAHDAPLAWSELVACAKPPVVILNAHRRKIGA